MASHSSASSDDHLLADRPRGEESPRVVSVVNVGDASVSVEVNRALSESELAIVGERSTKDVQHCRSSEIDNEKCAIAILKDVAATVKGFGDVDVSEISVTVSDTTVSKNLLH
jgi:hypothetical protein